MITLLMEPTQTYSAQEVIPPDYKENVTDQWASHASLTELEGRLKEGTAPNVQNNIRAGLVEHVQRDFENIADFLVVGLGKGKVTGPLKNDRFNVEYSLSFAPYLREA
ncbi:hypothetical protein GF323_05775 [Candidatus Woesearchaeota archaeon]|nr:hypothetical protein [Candidatus Woesearchaeota archaeon]